MCTLIELRGQSQLSFTLVFETGFPIGLGCPDSSGLSTQQAPKDPSVSTSPVLGLQNRHHAQDFYIGSGDYIQVLTLM